MGRVKMRKMSQKGPNLVPHPSAIRSIFQPRPRAPCLPRRRLPRREAFWLKPRLSLPERFLPKPRSDDTRFRMISRVVPHLRQPFWEARHHLQAEPAHHPLNYRVPSTRRARSGWYRSSHLLRKLLVQIPPHRREWLPERFGDGLSIISTRYWIRSGVGDVISSRCTSGSSGAL